MWNPSYWNKAYWAGTYWHPTAGEIVIAAITKRFTGMVANVGRLMTR